MMEYEEFLEKLESFRKCFNSVDGNCPQLSLQSGTFTVRSGSWRHPEESMADLDILKKPFDKAIRASHAFPVIHSHTHRELDRWGYEASRETKTEFYIATGERIVSRNMQTAKLDVVNLKVDEWQDVIRALCSKLCEYRAQSIFYCSYGHLYRNGSEMYKDREKAYYKAIKELSEALAD
jgi:hypothetical protein